jgi:hypothetical protein
VAMMLAISSVAGATGTYADLTGRDEYRPSTGLTLGTYYNPVASGNSHEGAIGYVIANPFQLNLLYQEGINDSAVEAFDDYSYPSGLSLNFPDNDYYFLRIDAGGSLPIGIWDYEETEPGGPQFYAPDSGESWVQWTLSYWSHADGYFQTILAGDMQVSGDETTLSVRPEGAYRTFLWDGLANDIEVFGGALIDCEVGAYTFTGPIGTGSVSGVDLVPEPGTMVLLVVGLVGLACRRFRA